MSIKLSPQEIKALNAELKREAFESVDRSEEFLRWLLDWVDVGDSKVCDTCKERAGYPPVTLEEWPAIPGDLTSECMEFCRCFFCPHVIADFSTTFQGGKSILLELEKESKNFPIRIEYEEKLFKQVDSLVLEYETITKEYYVEGNWNLPEKFYMSHTGNRKVEILEQLIKDIKNDTIPQKMKDSIIKNNNWWMKGKLPERKTIWI